MKKVLALVLAAVMALSLVTVVSALDITPGAGTYVGESDLPAEMNIGDKNFETAIVPATGSDFTAPGTSPLFATINGTDKYTVSASVTSSDSSVLAASLKIDTIKGSATAEGKKITLVLNPADDYFTVETKEVKVKIVVVQKASTSGSVAQTFSQEFTVKVSNKANTKDLFFVDATGKVTSVDKLTNPTIPAEVFTDVAKDKALELNFGDYSVNFAKVVNQNTSLYLKAKTSVVAKPTKAVASIAFQPTRVKDAATISMPISADNENLYGEKVFVYALVDNKPTGEAIEGTVVNHNSVIFSVPAGTALGTFAAYGDKALGDAEKPAIPETGANDIVNIAIVFAVVALAAAGFVAVKKASK